MNLKTEISNRRTFAIISHPDAGKTTLTEKLLLLGGAIQVAGAVKNNKIRKTATSDFLEIEKQRGISVATSVMTLDYKGKRINILDTPGHKDFAEDTYRTLTAVDSVILVVDCVKGVEEQTRKLMEVCRMRATPVMIFINKMDRDSKDPFDLLEELEDELKIATSPFSWPIGSGRKFKGVYNLAEKKIQLYQPEKSSMPELLLSTEDINDPGLKEHLDEHQVTNLREETELASEMFESFDKSLYLQGYLAPVFFGSALNNFGVPDLLETFINIAPPPLGTKTDQRKVMPEEENFSGFVFKIHANLDPKHRNRMAFLRISSGRFERNKMYFHTRLNRKMRFAAPATFMANDKSTVEEAFPGDVIGLYDTGNLKIGDSLTEGENLHFTGIPNFSPEILKEVVNKDPMKTKQLEKGVRQLTEEGLAQLFLQQPGNRKIIGTVGELQFDVIKFRLEHEYGAKCDFRTLPFNKAYWLSSDNKKDMDEIIRRRSNTIAYDKSGTPVYLAESDWMLKIAKETHPGISFHNTSEMHVNAETESV
ncbi:MAG TPA: peptide chain release factor 3 [Bacteroidales bacterium]|nr:peptide chain release factor 3 [Bacteroidales bacterium]